MKENDKIIELENKIEQLIKDQENFFKYISNKVNNVVKHDKSTIAWEIQKQQVEQMRKGDKLDKIIQIIKEPQQIKNTNNKLTEWPSTSFPKNHGGVMSSKE